MEIKAKRVSSIDKWALLFQALSIVSMEMIEQETFLSIPVISWSMITRFCGSGTRFNLQIALHWDEHNRFNML